MENAEAERFARALQTQAEAHDFDPLTGVAIIHFESNFNPAVISASGEDYGLAQIRARYIGACKYTKDPVKNPTPGCRKLKQQLLNPEANIRVMAEVVTANRKFCKQKIGSTQLQHWLASYQGRNNVRKKRYCVPGEGTWKVINYRRFLLKELKVAANPPQPKPVTKPASPSRPQSDAPPS